MTNKKSTNKTKISTQASKKIKNAARQMNSIIKMKNSVSKRKGPYQQVFEDIGGLVGFKNVAGRAGRFFDKVSGRGDYVMNGPVVKSNSLSNGTSPPMFGGNQKATIVRHREYIQDITTGPTLVNGATAFNYLTLPLNPGMNQTFPWGNQVAQNYEEFEIMGMIFEFKSTSANALNSTNTALGTVILSTEYNSLNPPFLNKLTQENYMFAQSIKPSESCLHAIECEVSKNVLSHLYVRTGPVPSGADQRLFDLGTFQLSTVGMQAANTVIGELWVTYEIAYFKPRVSSSPNVDVSGTEMVWSPTSSSAPFGGSGTQVPGSNLGNFITNVAGNQLIWPINVTSGTYLMVFKWTGGSVAGALAPSFSNFSNLTVNYAFGPPPVTTTSVVAYALVTINGSGAVLSASGGTLPTSSTCTIYVAPIPSMNAYGAIKKDDDEIYELFKKFMIENVGQNLSGKFADKLSKLDVALPSTVEEDKGDLSLELIQ